MMKKDQKGQNFLLTDNKANQSSIKKEKGFSQTNPYQSFSDNPKNDIPEEPDYEPEPARTDPGEIEPEKNDPMRIDKPPDIVSD